MTEAQLDHICFQWAAGDAAKARMWGSASYDTCDGDGGVADTAATCEVILNIP